MNVNLIGTKKSQYVVKNEVPAFGRIVPHVELHHRIQFLFAVYVHLLEPDSSSDELAEFLRADFTQPLEPCYLASRAKLPDCLLPFIIGIAVDILLLVAHPEQRRFKDIKMTRLHKWTEVRHKIRHEEKPDVESVDIRIGGNDDATSAQERLPAPG